MNLNHTIKWKLINLFLSTESQLKLANAELNKKLEEKTTTIKDLSAQLTAHEMNFEELKAEMKQVLYLKSK